MLRTNKIKKVLSTFKQAISKQQKSDSHINTVQKIHLKLSNQT